MIELKESYGNLDPFENDGTDIFTKNLFKLGLDDFLDSHPVGLITGEAKQGDIRIDFKLDGRWYGWNDWNVDLIKMYFIGSKGQNVIYTCHTGEKWINYNNTWNEFPCELYRPENPAISIEKLELSVCDKSYAGSSSNEVLPQRKGLLIRKL